MIAADVVAANAMAVNTIAGSAMDAMAANTMRRSAKVVSFQVDIFPAKFSFIMRWDVVRKTLGLIGLRANIQSNACSNWALMHALGCMIQCTVATSPLMFLHHLY